MNKVLAALFISCFSGLLVAISGGLLAPGHTFHGLVWLGELGALAGMVLGTPFALVVILRMLPNFSPIRDTSWLLVGAVVGGFVVTLLQRSPDEARDYGWVLVIAGPLAGGFFASVLLRTTARTHTQD